MLTNTLQSRVQIQLRVATIGATGETIDWKPVSDRFARIIPLRAEARAVYQQMNTVVTHKIIFTKGTVDLNIGNNRIKHGSKTYELVEPPQIIGNSIIIMVKEV